jgi:hypothetical protein
VQRSNRTIATLLLLLPILSFAACGGGSTATPLPALTPPAGSSASADFTISLSPAALTLTQGGIPQSLTATITAKNNFTGAVQLTLTNLPPGVTTNPASPIATAANASSPILIGASIATQPGAYAITAQATSGTLSHSATLSLTINTSIVATLPRTAYARTDSVPTSDDPLVEPHHRHLVYDAANHRLFVANRAMNRVEVFSTSNAPPATGIATRVAQIDVPGATSADLSADGTTVWVGTITQQAVAIDTASLQVKTRYLVPPQSLAASTTFDRPEEILALNNGNSLIRLRQSSASQSILMLWNSATSLLTNLNSAVPNGLGPMARTADHSKAIVAAADASGQLSVIDASGNVVFGPQAPLAGNVLLVAANTDGSRFAATVNANGSTELLLLDAQLSLIASTPSANIAGLTFSRDGKFLYASRSDPMFPAVAVFDGQTLQFIGDVSDLSVQGVQSEIEDADENGLLFGIANRGVSFIDATNPGALPPSVPAFAFPPAAQPAAGAPAGGTSVALAGQNFESTAIVVFGSQPATNASVSSAGQIQLNAPPNVVSGAVNVTAYFPSGWIAIAPDGFSYGPQILKTLPNAGNNAGGDLVQIYGYGFGTDANRPAVSMGGAIATIQKIESVGAIEPSLGLGASYPFALQRITLQTPPAATGKADIVVKSASGTATVTDAFQFLQSVQVNSNPHFYKFLLYDKLRQLVYVSYDAGIDVFPLPGGSPTNGSLQMYCPSKMEPGPCPDADVRGLALTPNGSQVIAADFGSQNIFLFNPDILGDVSWVPANSPGYGPARVAATSDQTVFVSLQSIANASGPCSACLSQLNLSSATIETASQSEVGSMTATPLIQSDAAGDRVVLAFSANSVASVALWDASDPNNFANFSTDEPITDVATSADGTMFATTVNTSIEIRDASLNLIGWRTSAKLEQFVSGTIVPGIQMHPTGALTFQPYLDGPAPPEEPNGPPANPLHGGIDIFDSRSGQLRLRVALPEPLAAYSDDVDALRAQFMALDETGQRIFAITKSGLTVVQLAELPLAIGTLSGSSVPASGGATITIRGSGFVAGTTATIGGKSAAVAFLDAATISITTPAVAAGPQRLTLTNPDGETTSLDAAFTAN